MLRHKGLKEILALKGSPYAQPGQTIFCFTAGSRNLQGYGVQPVTLGDVYGVNASLLRRV